jgi:hypothetical protein
MRSSRTVVETTGTSKRARSQAGEFKSARTAISTIVRREGRRGLFAGYGAFLIRDLPFDAIEFWAYDTLKITYTAFVGRDLNGVEASGCGAVAGAVTGALWPCVVCTARHRFCAARSRARLQVRCGCMPPICARRCS